MTPIKTRLNKMVPWICIIPWIGRLIIALKKWKWSDIIHEERGHVFLKRSFFWVYHKKLKRSCLKKKKNWNAVKNVSIFENVENIIDKNSWYFENMFFDFLRLLWNLWRMIWKELRIIFSYHHHFSTQYFSNDSKRNNSRLNIIKL